MLAALESKGSIMSPDVRRSRRLTAAACQYMLVKNIIGRRTEDLLKAVVFFQYLNE